MQIIAIPIFGSRISPRLDLANNLQIIKVEKKKIVKSENIKLISHNRLERINMIIALQPDVIICDGLSDICKEEIGKSNIKLISWVHGEISEVIKKFIQGKLEDRKIN